MESRNPVFQRNAAFSNKGGYATFDARGTGTGQTPQDYPPQMTPQQMEAMYAAPPASAVQMGRMTIDDVVVRTAMIFGVLLLTAVPTYFFMPVTGFGAVLLAGLVAFGIAMAISFSKKIRPALILLYAAVEGVFVGAISAVYASVWNGIVPQAILGTLGAFTAMLLLYSSGKFRVTPKFTRVMITALIGYVIFGFANLLLSLFTSWNVYNSPLGWLVAGFGVVFASFFLMLDFDAIEQGIRNGAPQQYAWLASWGLVVTLVWLYLEILRLIAILRN